MTNRTTIFAFVALPVVALACLALGARMAPGLGAAADNPSSPQMAEVLARLEAIERRQARPGLGVPDARHAAGRAADPGAAIRRAHTERLRNDPAYAARREQERLATMDKSFMSEPVDTRWAARVSAQVEDSVELANLQSKLDIGAGQVECRSQTCRIRIDSLSPDKGYEDFVTFLTTELAGVLPSARLVTIHRPDGTQSVTIFARSATPQPRRE